MREKDLYNLLEIDKNASKEEIKKAYREKAKTHHPDNKGDPNKFIEIALAYSVLTDEKKRAYYDKTGKINVNTKDEKSKAAYSRLCQLFLIIIDKQDDQIFRVDVVGLLRKSIFNHMKKGKELLRNFEQKGKYLEKIKRRIKCKKNKVNIFDAMIEDKLKNCNFMISQGKFDLEVFAEMNLILNDFEFDYDKVTLNKTYLSSMETKIDFSWWGG